MANTDKPDGFTPAYHMYGGVIRPAEMRIASGYGTSIFSGDVVTLASGYVNQARCDKHSCRCILWGILHRVRWHTYVF